MIMVATSVGFKVLIASGIAFLLLLGCSRLGPLPSQVVAVFGYSFGLYRSLNNLWPTELDLKLLATLFGVHYGLMGYAWGASWLKYLLNANLD